jgi:hypothetical protein
MISTQDRTIDLTSIGGIKFEEHNHRYTNKDGVKYNGVTTLLKNYEHEFDSEIGSINSAIKYVITEEFGEEKFNILKRQCKNEQLSKLSGLISKEDEKFVFGHNFLHEKLYSITNKYPSLKHRIEENRIRFLKEWKETSDEAIKIGSLAHDLKEQDIKKNGYWFEGVHYKYIEGKNILNVTTDDVIAIPECMVWNHDVKLGGLADVFLFNKGFIKVHDYKTNESIEMESFLGKKMKGCCYRLMDSSYFHYSLQLRIYQKMALDLRKDFKQSENYIIHTKSEKYNRTEDNLIKCFEVENEVIDIFNDLYKQQIY